MAQLGLPRKKLVPRHIERVVDGDTVVITDGTKYRLYGIDAPESKQRFGPEAAAALTAFLKETDNDVLVQEQGKEKYGRTLATLYSTSATALDGSPRNINYRMILRGFAWSYRFKKEETVEKNPVPSLDVYDSAESVARLNRVGLWVDAVDGFMPENPSTYRKRIKRERSQRKQDGTKKGNRKPRSRKHSKSSTR